MSAHVVRVAQGDSASLVTAVPLKPNKARNSSRPSVAASTLESPSISMRWRLRCVAMFAATVRPADAPIAPCVAAVPVMPSIQRNARMPSVIAVTLKFASASRSQVAGRRLSSGCSKVREVRRDTRQRYRRSENRVRQSWINASGKSIGHRATELPAAVGVAANHASASAEAHTRQRTTRAVHCARHRQRCHRRLPRIRTQLQRRNINCLIVATNDDVELMQHSVVPTIIRSA